MKFRSFPVLCALVVALAQPEPATGRDWVEYTSENFTVYSDLREEDAVAVLENFEIFRLTALAVLNLPTVAESERLMIFAFDRGRDFNRIRPSSEVGGFYYHSIFGPRMMVGPGGEAHDTQAVLFHEYVHYLMNLHGAQNYPRWYSEGLAMLLSSVDISESSIVVGKPPAGYSRAVQLGFDTTVYDVIDMRHDGASFEFYVTSWLMAHYLLLDAVNAPERTRSTIDYLRRFDAGEDPVEAFSASFGISPSEMQRELIAYSRRNALTGLFMPRIDYTGGISSRVMRESESLYRLGDIAVELDEYDAAREYFDSFDGIDEDSPFQVNVMSRRAIAYVHEGRIDEGDALIDRLLAENRTDADVLADIAHYAYDRFVDEHEDSGDAERMHLQRSIQFGERAVESNPGDLEALYYLGLAYEADGKLQLAVDTLLRSYDVNPSVPRLNINLVRLLVKGRQTELASYLVSRLYSANHSEEGRARLRKLQQDIETGNVDLTELGDL